MEPQTTMRERRTSKRGLGRERERDFILIEKTEVMNIVKILLFINFVLQ